jgi:hypothetical protein
MKTFDDIILKNESAYQNYRSYVKDIMPYIQEKWGIYLDSNSKTKTWVF